MSETLKTRSGKSPDEVRAILRKHLPPEAYKPVPGAEYLTDINPAYLGEALNDAFGLCGYGWGYDYSTADLKMFQETRQGQQRQYTVWIAIIELFQFWYFLDDEKMVILSSGSSDNNNPGYALKGAVTRCLSAATSKLDWQLDIYQGTHEPERKGKPTEPHVPPPDKPESQVRLQNQWEQNVVEKILDLSLIDNRNHAIAILNNSHFFTTVPFGELVTKEVVAYFITYAEAHETMGDKEPIDRKNFVEENWQSHLEDAQNMLGG